LVLSDLKKQVQDLPRRKHPVELAVHTDNWHGYNEQKGADEMRRDCTMPLDDSSSLPDLSPCDFWLFGVLNNRMKETVFRNAD
jgi:hypothetical protein